MHMTSSSLIKSANGFTTVPLDARLLSKRIIYIDDQTITGELIAEVISKIMILVSEDASSMITILLDSEGGGVRPGMVLYDLLQSCRTPIRLVVAGKAYSMAALLFASGRHGRYMLPSSELMIHQPMFEGQVPGNGETMKTMLERLEKEKQKMIALFAKHTGQSVEKIKEAISYDHFYDPEQAMAFGLCDGIITFKEILEGEM